MQHVCVDFRWDLQRLREQTAYEKLKDRQERVNEPHPKEIQTDGEVESFYADLDESRCIHKCYILLYKK